MINCGYEDTVFIFMNFFTKKNIQRENYNGRLAYAPKINNSKINHIAEALKGFVQRNTIRFPASLGEEHPVNYGMIDAITKVYGILSAITDKHVDFMMSGGINIKSESERAKQIIDNFMVDTQFDSLMRTWFKQAFRFGFSPLELSENKNNVIDEMQVLDSRYVYVQRDEHGIVEGYNQFLKPLKDFKTQFLTNEKEVQPFKPRQIAALNINVFGSNFYGHGIIYPLLAFTDQIIGDNKNMHTIMQRKANNPLIFLMGDKTAANGRGIYPSKPEMDNLGNQLQWLNNKHEWVLSDFVKPMTLDFGKLSDKFEFLINNDLFMLFAAAQIPEVLMGKGSVPEGLAKVQMRAWELRIQSLREAAEKVIETNIFQRVLLSNGVSEKVEIVWGLPTQEEKNDTIKVITELLKNPFINMNYRIQLEKETALLLDISPDEIDEPGRERDKEDGEEKIPVVPEERQRSPSKTPPSNGIAKDLPVEQLEESIAEYPNMRVSEWVGFNYKEYNDDVLDVTKIDRFELLRGVTKQDFDAGKLNSQEIDKLRSTMLDAFEENKTVRDIQDELNKKIEFKDALRTDENGNVILKKGGGPAIGLSAKYRPLAIARNETTRLSNLGALKNYRKHDIKEYRWISAVSERTCEYCASMNGIILKENSGVMPPLHPLCRCTISPVLGTK